MYEVLNLKYAYLYKHKVLFDLISKQYEAFNVKSKELLSRTFGEKSDLKTANYGQIMRWICVKMKDLREETDERTVDGDSSERYKYGTEPSPLMVIDGKTGLNQSYIPWKADFSKEMNKFGYDSSAIEIIRPDTNEVVNIDDLRKDAYEKTLEKNYLRVVIAVDREMTRNVLVDDENIGKFWITNTTIRDIKKIHHVPDNCELTFNGELYDDCTTLSSLSPCGDISFKKQEVRPNIYFGGNWFQLDPLSKIGELIDYYEKLYPKMKIVLWSGCQPPKDMTVKDVVKYFGNWRTGELNLFWTENFVHVLMYPEEYDKMDSCGPLVDTYVDGSVNLQENLLERFACKLSCLREVYNRINHPKWVLIGDDDINSHKHFNKCLLGKKNSLERELKREFDEIEFVLAPPEPDYGGDRINPRRASYTFGVPSRYTSHVDEIPEETNTLPKGDPFNMKRRSKF